ncbi:MAG: DUF4157 domain-containing protein [Cyanothece sp. SIO1E1]|nr:DUF4157 domain-containing protein [Cyanothece sp. SIO1E1]
MLEEELQTKPQLQREALEEEEGLQTKPQLQREELSEDDELQMKPQSAAIQNPLVQAKGTAPTMPENFESQLAQYKGSGQPLSEEARSFMEPRFGADFSHVRVHETPDLANTVQAQAFTHGQDIYFNAGKYNPGSSSGKELLAHELTHVVQQVGDSNVFSVQRNPASQLTTSSNKYVKILCQTWNVRKKPLLSASKIEPPLTYGERVKLIKEESECWLKVFHQGREGYIYRKPWIKIEFPSSHSTQSPVPENRYGVRLIPPLREPNSTLGAPPVDLSIHLEPDIPLDPGLPDWFWKKLPSKPKRDSFIKLVSNWLTEKLGRRDIARIASKLAGRFGFDDQKIRKSLNEEIVKGGEKGIEKLLRKLLEKILGKAQEIESKEDVFSSHPELEGPSYLEFKDPSEELPKPFIFNLPPIKW